MQLPNNWNSMTGPEQFRWFHDVTPPGGTVSADHLPEGWFIARPLRGRSRLTVNGTTYRITRRGSLAPDSRAAR